MVDGKGIVMQLKSAGWGVPNLSLRSFSAVRTAKINEKSFANTKKGYCLRSWEE